MSLTLMSLLCSAAPLTAYHRARCGGRWRGPASTRPSSRRSPAARGARGGPGRGRGPGRGSPTPAGRRRGRWGGLAARGGTWGAGAGAGTWSCSSRRRPWGSCWGRAAPGTPGTRSRRSCPGRAPAARTRSRGTCGRRRWGWGWRGARPGCSRGAGAADLGRETIERLQRYSQYSEHCEQKIKVFCCLPRRAAPG